MSSALHQPSLHCGALPPALSPAVRRKGGREKQHPRAESPLSLVLSLSGTRPTPPLPRSPNSPDLPPLNYTAPHPHHRSTPTSALARPISPTQSRPMASNPSRLRTHATLPITAPPPPSPRLQPPRPHVFHNPPATAQLGPLTELRRRHCHQYAHTNPHDMVRLLQPHACTTPLLHRLPTTDTPHIIHTG